MLSEQDELSIIGTGDKSVTYFTNPDDTIPTKSQKRQFKMYSATLDNKFYFKQFITNLNASKEMTNHSFAFHNAFSLLYNMQTSKNLEHNTPIQMVYISRGLISPLTEAKNVLQTIANGQKRSQKLNPVVIDTCAIILGKKKS